jgi:hypothetical protein
MSPTTDRGSRISPKPALATGVFNETDIEWRLGSTMWDMVTKMTNGRSSATEEGVRKVAGDAVRAANLHYGQEEAREWGGDFKMPDAIVAQDEADFASVEPGQPRGGRHRQY